MTQRTLLLQGLVHSWRGERNERLRLLQVSYKGYTGYGSDPTRIIP
jgi:hypothetical protein